MRPRLYISHEPDRDCLTALEFGRVDDGQPNENWRHVDGELSLLHDGSGGPPLGFRICPFSEFDTEAPDVAEIWEPPTFDAPLVGLTDVPAGEVILAVRRLLGDEPTVNRIYFDAATRESGERALGLWLCCLEAGDSMAHFALGFTLYELGRHHEAYRHLRHYAEIAPAHPWNQVWLGKAAEALGELAEAQRAYERAIELTEAGEDETDAPELLAALRAPIGKDRGDGAR